jgi:hypothetical protein
LCFFDVLFAIDLGIINFVLTLDGVMRACSKSTFFTNKNLSGMIMLDIYSDTSWVLPFIGGLATLVAVPAAVTVVIFVVLKVLKMGVNVMLGR